MFSDHHQQPPPPPLHFHHQLHLSDTTTTTTTNTNDGSSVEVVRRPRGRPPGSKNKHKPPVVINREPDPYLSPYVLEVDGGSDIVAAIYGFCNHRKIGVCVLSGTGTVTGVTLRQISTTVTFHGCLELQSISATVFPSSSPSPAVTTPFAGGFTVTFSAPKGQMVGGAVVGPLIAAGTVYIIAAAFNNPLYHRLPIEEDDHVRCSDGGSGSAAREQSPVSGGGGNGGNRAPPSTAADSLSMFNRHLPSDAIWAPTPRQAPTHPSLY